MGNSVHCGHVRYSPDHIYIFWLSDLYIYIRKSMVYGGKQRFCCLLLLTVSTKTTMTRQFGPCARYYSQLLFQLKDLWTYVMKSTNVHVWNMFLHVIHYQHVSIPFAIIVVSVIGVDLQEYKEYNNLRRGISGTLKDLWLKFMMSVSNIEYFNLFLLLF
jgi:hypothetical protein